MTGAFPKKTGSEAYSVCFETAFGYFGVALPTCEILANEFKNIFRGGVS